MVAASLWAEMTIAGFFYLVAVFFMTLRVLNVATLDFMTGLKDYFIAFSVGIIGLSYLFGMLSHQLIGIFLRPAFGFVAYMVRSLLSLIERVFGISRSRRKQSRKQKRSFEKTIDAKMKVEIWIHGSDKLHRELAYSFNALSFFTSLTVALPLVGLAFQYWMAYSQPQNDSSPKILVGCLILMVLCIVVDMKQLAYYRYLQYNAYEAVKRIRAKGTDNKSLE